MTSDPRNTILGVLPRTALAALEPHLSYVSFAPGEIVMDLGIAIKDVYFPVSGIGSLQVVMEDGRIADTAMVGRESIVEAALGGCKSTSRFVTRTGLIARRISALALRRAAANELAITKACIQYTEALLLQAGISAGRYALNSVDERLASCLLDASQLLQADDVPLAHEVLANMLSARCSSVTEAALRLRQAGLITYLRGSVKILNRTGLKRLAKIEV